MAITYVGAGAVVTGTNPSIPYPSGIQIGDLLLIFMVGNATPPTTSTNPLPWTRIYSTSTVSVWAREYTGTGTSQGMSYLSTTTQAVMLAYRGATTVQTVGAAVTGTGTTATTSTLTTLAADTTVISLFTTGQTASTWTPDPTINTRINRSSGPTSGLLICDEIQNAIGLSTARTATLSASIAWAGVQIALVPTTTYYWVGGTGNWTSSGTTNWASTSGGPGGAGVPTLINDVVFDNNSSGGAPFTVTASSGATCASLRFGAGVSALTHTMTLNGTISNVSGDFYLPSTNISLASTFSATLASTMTGRILDTGGNTFGTGTYVFNGGGYFFTNNWNAPTGTITLSLGYLETNSYQIDISSFSSAVSTIRGLYLVTSTINLYGSGTVWNLTATSFTSSMSSSTINILSSTAGNKTFVNQGIYGTINDATSGSSGFVIFSASGTIGTLRCTRVGPASIAFGNTAGAIIIQALDLNTSAVNTRNLISSSGTTERDITYNGGRVNYNYVSMTRLSWNYTLSGSSPYRIYLGPQGTNGGGNTGVAFIDGSQFTAYRLVSGTTFTIPSNWSSTNNSIHLFGGGGGGGAGRIAGVNRAAGGGGGGGGYTLVTNFSATAGQTVSYAIGAAATFNTEASGGNTTWNSGAFIAGGGGGGSSNATVPSSIAGVGGSGTFAGGNGGLGFTTVSSQGVGGGGGGGSGGPLGVGGTGGNGAGNGSGAWGGGGGGSSGGTNGQDGNAITFNGGAGGNNASGFGGGASASRGQGGGGGGGGDTFSLNGIGSLGFAVQNSFGSSGGNGGGSDTTQSGSSAIFSAGGGGVAVSSDGTVRSGGQSGPGVIYIIYSTAPPPPPPPSTPVVLSGVTISGGITIL
jgi:hypothetical protein